MEKVTIEINCTTCHKKHKIRITKKAREGKEPFKFACPDVTRLYRLITFFIDGRRGIFDDLKDIKNAHVKNMQKEIKKHLILMFGEHEFSKKFKRWKSINPPCLYIIEEYVDKLNITIDAYSCGYFYPAMTSACALGERILNRLLLKTKKHFKSNQFYKKVYNKDSFNDWDFMIKVLADWKILNKELVDIFAKLKEFRNDSIHYNENYNFKKNTLIAINYLIEAINNLFGVMKRTDIFWIFNVPGEIWLKSEAENLPFVKEFIISHCYQAHAIHQIDEKNNKILEDGAHVGPLSDLEFIELRKRYHSNNIRNN